VGSSPTPRTFDQTREIVEEAINFGLWLKREGYSESTIRSRVKILKNVMKNCNIFDIDDFKTFLANTKWCDGTKQNNVDVYRCYARYKGLKAENLPKYNRDYSLPFIPLEKEIDTLI